MKNEYEKYVNSLGDLEALLRNLTPDQIVFKAEEGKWNVNEIIAHLADAEVRAYVRYRSMLADDVPFLVNHNEAKWSTELKHATVPVVESLSLLKTMREINYKLICSLNDEQMSREGLHSKRGKMTVRDLVEGHIRHLDNHIGQIKRNISEYTAAKKRQDNRC